MSLIADYPLHKVEPYLARHNPCQWSENLQLAVAGFDHLTILEPKLPSLHQGIVKVNENSVLDPKHLFQQYTILDQEQFQYLPLGKFNKMSVDSADETFNISGINDPTIVGHQWSLNSQTSRDVMLGILFNTGELLILSRKNVQITKYEVRVDMFEVLANHFGIKEDENGFSVTSSEKTALNIKCFSLSTLTIESEEVLLVTIINGNDTLFVYRIDQKTYKTQLLGSQELGFRAVMIKWSKWIHSKSYLAITSVDNAINSFELTFENDSLEISTPSILNAPTRFQCAKQEYIYIENTSYLIAVFTGRLSIFEMGAPIKAYTHTFDSFLSCSSIVTGLVGTVVTIILALENGSFVTVGFDTIDKSIKSSNTDKALKSFVARALYTYQISNTNPEVDEEGASKDVEDEDGSGMEGIFVTHGLHIISNDILALVYKVIPKDVYSHITRTQYISHLQFIKLSSPIKEADEEVFNRTSIAKTVVYWLQNYEKIPCFQSATHENVNIEAFIDEIDKFAKETLVDIETFEDEIDKYATARKSHFGTDFGGVLIDTFNRNPIVNRLQYYHTLGKIVINALIVFKQKSEKLTNLLDHCKLYLLSIEQTIRIYLQILIVEFVTVNKVPLEDEFDKFLMITIVQQLNEFGIHVDIDIPSMARVTIATKFYAETFEIHVDDIIRDDKLMVSTTEHGWLQCKLCNVPLLQMNNRRDELAQFQYIIAEDNFGNLITTLLRTIEFCYITGNKTYKLK